MTLLRPIIICLALFTVSAPALAQGARVAFGAGSQDASAPVEVTADELAVDQANGSAIFTGNVLIGQGDLRLSAQRVLVVYHAENAGIARLEASGGVTLVAGADAAESENANYDIDSGSIVMTGNVLLSQGASVLTSNSMTVNVSTGTAQMSGRVKTVLKPSDK